MLDTGDKQPVEVNLQKELGSKEMYLKITKDVLQEQKLWKPNTASELKGNCEYSVGTPDGSFPREKIFEKAQIHDSPNEIKFNPENSEYQNLRDTT